MVNADAHEIARGGVGIKNQVPDVMNGLSVSENLWLAAASRWRGAAIAKASERIA
jgi:ABC-type uncharacterized transport system ATPase subunit